MKTADEGYLVSASRWVYKAPEHFVRRLVFSATFPDLPMLAFRFVSWTVFLLLASISYYIQDELQQHYLQLQEQGLLDDDTIFYPAHPLIVALGVGGLAAACWPVFLWGARTLLNLSLCVVALFMRVIEYIGSVLGSQRALIDQSPGALLIGGVVATCLWLGFLVS